MRFRLKPVVFTLLCIFAHSAVAEEPRAQDKPAEELVEPVLLEADNLTGDKKNQVEATGNAILSKSDQSIRADRIFYDQETKDAEGFGSVVLNQAGSTASGPYIKLNMDTHAGLMEQPEFYLKDTDGRGSGDMLHIQDQQHFDLDNAVYTTCPAGNQDWFIKTTSLEIDRDQQVGVAHNAWVEFMDTPILYSPWMDFPLNSQRKTGFLSPTFGGSTKGGSELTVPYYWNIAPNQDATFSPRMMMKRGVLFNNEYRYLEPDYAGEVHADVLPNDTLTHSNRARFGLKHGQSFGGGFSGSVNFNRVSDNAYYRDLADVVNVATQVNLLQDAALTYSGGWWGSTARVQRYQTLRDPLA
ncbi:MAG: LPS assembly protein LptD, partial [Gallionella sp.]